MTSDLHHWLFFKSTHEIDVKYFFINIFISINYENSRKPIKCILIIAPNWKKVNARKLKSVERSETEESEFISKTQRYILCYFIVVNGTCAILLNGI